MVSISVWPMWCWLQDEDPCKTDTRHMEAKHEESPKCKRVKTGNKIRGNHENIAPSLWSKYCKLMDDIGAPSKVRRSMNIESWSVWLVLRSPGWTSSWLCLCKKKSHIFMPQVEPEKASLTLYTTISIKILSKFPTSHFCLLLPGGWDLVYLVSSRII